MIAPSQNCQMLVTQVAAFTTLPMTLDTEGQSVPELSKLKTRYFPMWFGVKNYERRWPSLLLFHRAAASSTFLLLEIYS